MTLPRRLTVVSEQQRLLTPIQLFSKTKRRAIGFSGVEISPSFAMRVSLLARMVMIVFQASGKMIAYTVGLVMTHSREREERITWKETAVQIRSVAGKETMS